jgi:hypothetical protein
MTLVVLEHPLFLQLSGALRYLKDAEEKGAWEQVPGAASVVLDTVYHIVALIGDKLPNHQRCVKRIVSAFLHNAHENHLLAEIGMGPDRSHEL